MDSCRICIAMGSALDLLSTYAKPHCLVEKLYGKLCVQIPRLPETHCWALDQTHNPKTVQLDVWIGLDWSCFGLNRGSSQVQVPSLVGNVEGSLHCQPEGYQYHCLVQQGVSYFLLTTGAQEADPALSNCTPFHAFWWCVNMRRIHQPNKDVLLMWLIKIISYIVFSIYSKLNGSEETSV